jgi:hypothetical protein
MTGTARQYQPSVLELLAEAAEQVTQLVWGAIVEDAVEAAKRRFAELTNSDALEEPLQLAFVTEDA